MHLYNYTESMVFRVIDDVLKKNSNICGCKRCRFDIAAIALNNLKPRYVVSERGELFTKVDEMEFQNIADIIKEVTHAIKLVKEKPRHE